MVLLGLSILIASISYLCYRHPPSLALLLRWFNRPSITSSPRRTEQDAPETLHAPPDSSTSADVLQINAEEEKSPMISITEMADPPASKTVLDDRIAMPPPPPPFKKPSSSSPPTLTSPTSPTSPTTPRASSDNTQSSVPTFTLGNHDDHDSDEEADYDKMPPPSFPALNSAQRTSSLPKAAPRLNFLPISPSAAPKPGLMLPPSRGPLPNRNPPTITNNVQFSLAPPPTHTAIPTKPRKKVLLTPGHSPLDWARLSSSPTANLRGLPPSTPYLKVPPSLLKQYNGRPVKPTVLLPSGEKKRMDAWTVLGGKVYNMTPYLPYHPGGEPELLRAAGKDGTKLFGEVHPWVNWEGMLEGCLVGIAVKEEEVSAGQDGGALEEMD